MHKEINASLYIYFHKVYVHTVPKEAVPEYMFYKIFRCVVFYISLEFTNLTKVIRRMAFEKMEKYEG